MDGWNKMTTFKQSIKQFFTGFDDEDKFYYFEDTKSWENLIEDFKSSTADAFGEGFEFCDTIKNIELYFDDAINSMLEVDFRKYQPLDLVSRIYTIDNLPEWIRSEYANDIESAIEELESGHECKFCSGSGEGMGDVSTCTICGGLGVIQYKGIYSEGEY